MPLFRPSGHQRCSFALSWIVLSGGGVQLSTVAAAGRGKLSSTRIPPAKAIWVPSETSQSCSAIQTMSIAGYCKACRSAVRGCSVALIDGPELAPQQRSFSIPPPIPCCADGDDEKYKYKLVETAAFEDHEEAVGSIPASDAFIRISAHVDDIHFGHDRLRPFFMVPEGRALARMYENLAEGRESLTEGALKPLQLVVERDRLMALDGNRRLAVLKALHCRHPEMFDGWLDDCHVLTTPSPPRVKRKITTSPMVDGRTVRFE
ncbi:hypothetical protein FOZ62_025434, partial [Perkinsus olseni]